MATNTNGNIELNKKHTILLVIAAVISIVINLTQPFVWAAKMESLQEWQNAKLEAAERRITKLEVESEIARQIQAELKFNLRRLMEDKFGMKYIEDPHILYGSK